MKYKIKNDYLHREEPEYCDNTNNSDEWQHEVYQLGYTIAKIIDKLPVLDIGCVSGYKLINIFKEFDTIGVELEPTYKFLVNKYPDKTWYIKDDNPPTGKFGVLISADVIEHVLNPDKFLNYMKNIDFKYLILSTPYRDSLDLSQDGPPHNPTHCREWTLNEFNLYIKEHFNIVNHFIINKKQSTQCIIAEKYK